MIELYLKWWDYDRTMIGLLDYSAEVLSLDHQCKLWINKLAMDCTIDSAYDDIILCRAPSRIKKHWRQSPKGSQKNLPIPSDFSIPNCHISSPFISLHLPCMFFRHVFSFQIQHLKRSFQNLFNLHFSNHLQESPKNPMLRLYISTILGISMGHFPRFFPSIFPMNLFQVGIPYLCMKLFAGPVELRDPLPLQRYGLAGDSAVQVMTTRPGGKGWENPGKTMGKCPNHGKHVGKSPKSWKHVGEKTMKTPILLIIFV